MVVATMVDIMVDTTVATITILLPSLCQPVLPALHVLPVQPAP